MKKWNTPAVAELNVELTANGFFSCNKEVCFLSHEHKGCDQDKDKTDDVVTNS